MPRALATPSPQDLDSLEHWTRSTDGKCLQRTIEFEDFSAAFAFMTRVAMRAEQIDHHPDWRNVWRRVEIRLTTHDADGLTQLDIDLARFVDSIAPDRNA